ncbi:glucosyltransferase [Dentipellis sp. KUC8613]|nr:glucosyltransferase [Dentipellis sp. KUC8613]
MHKNGMREWVVPCVLLVSALVRWCVGLASYSGQGTPPMFGDYEAQRHWMELTIHLPIRQWYTYDLQYWGLDYPPLTAYVSWICGFIGSFFDPTWFALDRSRGIETSGSKVYMRTTVFVLDHLVYVPAVWFFVRIWHASRSRRTQNLALITLLLQPALLLIDFGHFQYNSVMLGLTMLAINAFVKGHDLLGAFFFVLSLGFKQMALYYAPAIGSFLIGKCLYLGPQEGTRLFVRLAVVTIASFLLLFLPFLPPLAPFSAILDPVTRIFPFNRGIFEDKVANFWCASNVVVKWKFWASRAALVRLSTLLTALGFLPAAIAPIRAWVSLKGDSATEKTKKDEAPKTVPPALQPVLLHALLTSSMSFFLFSFQVHEKTILLPLMPLTLLMSGASQDSTLFKIGALTNNVGVFSMWPLLRRDGLAVQYIALLALWNRLIGHNPFRFRGASFLDYFSSAVYLACLALHALELLVSPPPRYPDIFPVLNVLVSTPIFVLTWLWCIQSLIQARWAVGSLGVGTRSRRTSITSEKGSVSHGADAPASPVDGFPLKGVRHVRSKPSSLGYASSSGSSRRRPPVSKASSVSGGD